MKNINRIIAFVMVFTLVATMTTFAATEITVEFRKEEPVIILSNEGERIFDLQYDFGVDFTHVTTGIDVVLVLDRSNSMLKADPATGLPVADAVWGAVNDFVTEVYTTYPKSNIAIVSFGTNGNKSDNWKYYNNLEDVKEEIEEVYDYRDLTRDYHPNFSSYSNNGYRYAWENWRISDGATNISAAFEYAETTVGHKQTVEESLDQDVIVLFTDGVATQGGSRYQKNYNYPSSHNTNTIAAYEAGISAQSAAEVITVGYFGGIDYSSTKNIARDTLVRAQNAGFFEAEETGHLSEIFETIVDELNYIGTDARVVEIIENEFEVVDGSIEPAGYELSFDHKGRQVITWPLGHVVSSDYEFGYKVRVKDDVYPTGSGTIEIPINEEAMLYYTDLNGDEVQEPLGQSFTTIPARDHEPVVDVHVNYKNNQFGYLVGDEIEMDHILEFENIAPFDYRHIAINKLVRKSSVSNLASYIDLSQSSIDSGWLFAGETLTYTIGEERSVTGDSNLMWDKTIPFAFTAIKAGTYRLSHEVGFDLTNSVDMVFDHKSVGQDTSSIDVRQGSLSLELIDEFGVAITNISLLVDGEEVTTVVDDSGKIVVNPLNSGSHTISFPLPSGYNLIDSQEGVSINEGKLITTVVELDYDDYLVDQTIRFERLTLKDIEITTLDGKYVSSIDTVDEIVPSKVVFTLTRELDKIGLTMSDDFEGSSHIFTLSEVAGVKDVRNLAGDIVPGFTMNGNKLVYEGPRLSTGVYTAFGLMTPPNLGTALDYDYKVEVNEVITREDGDEYEIGYEITSLGLYIGVTDNVAPVIESVQDDVDSTLNLINQDITITDKTTITKYEVYSGVLSYEELLLVDELLAFELVEDLGNTIILDGDILVDLSVNELGGITSSGAITIYAEDAFGNYSLKVVEYENTQVDQLLDEDLV